MKSSPDAVDGLTHDLGDFSPHLRAVVKRAKRENRPVVVAENGQPSVAIVDIAELDRLYEVEQRLFELEDAVEARAVVEEFLAAERRGEVEWMSEEEFGEFERRLLEDVRQGKLSPHDAGSAAE